MNRNSVLFTQAQLSKAKDTLRRALERTEELKREVDRLTECHRAQILRSMLKKGTDKETEEDRIMARGISHYHDVPIPEL